MGIVSAQELHSYLHNEDGSINRDTLPMINSVLSYCTSIRLSPDAITLDDVETALNTLHTRIAGGTMLPWKSVRPWSIVKMEDLLDPAVPWIGWEVETGWLTEQARAQAMKRLIDNYNHVALDQEGPEYGVEMTWSPANNGKFEGAHPLHFVADVARDYQELVYNHETYEHVGTHVNISTPSMRLLNHRDLQEVANALNYELSQWFAFNDFEKLFGRGEMYGGFFARPKWIEGKLFNTTYDKSTADGYIAVADKLAVVMEQLAQTLLDTPERRQWTLRAHDLLTYLRGVEGSAVSIGWGESEWIEAESLDSGWHEPDVDDYDDDYDDDY